MPRLRLSLLLSLLIASSASGVTMDWTPIGDPGNACDPQPQSYPSGGCFGAVGYGYSIGTYEVTNAQFAEFLNAKAASDPLALYDSQMSVMQVGSSGSYQYVPVTGRETMPVNFVSFYSAMRFANWLNNGQGSGSTETGAYTLLGGTATPSNGTTVTRNAGATIALPTEDEWYKAAYYDSRSTSYFDYPAGSNTATTCGAPTATPNSANCGFAVGDVVAVGSYSGSASPFGTYDQGGNVFEWSETLVAPGQGTWRNTRNGSFDVGPAYLAADSRGGFEPQNRMNIVGIRIAMIPEPSTGLLVVAGLIGLAGRRRARE
jgi:PEP-CTERM putative exosortase interaction domain